MHPADPRWAEVRRAPGGAVLEPFAGVEPVVEPSAWCHWSAVLIGDVVVASRATIWPTVVLRGDQGSVRIGPETSVQDGTVVHATQGLSWTRVGARCTIGHRVVLHGCTIEDDVLVGMGAVVLDNAVVESFCVIGAGAVVGAGKRIPRGSLVMGVPGKVVRTLNPDEIEGWIRYGHTEYQRLLDAWMAEVAADGSRGGAP